VPENRSTGFVEVTQTVKMGKDSHWGDMKREKWKFIYETLNASFFVANILLSSLTLDASLLHKLQIHGTFCLYCRGRRCSLWIFDQSGKKDPKVQIAMP
jgi:hypothetical protein